MPYQRFNSYKKTEYKGPTKAAIVRSSLGQGWVDVVSPYDRDYVEELKSSIQPSHRKWDPQSQVWHVNELYLEELVALLKKHFDEVTTNLLSEEPVPSNLFRPVFEALKDLPNGNLDKVYKQLAVAVHPDHGGSDELMKKLNEAYQETRK